MINVTGLTAATYQASSSLTHGEYPMWVGSINADVVGEWSDAAVCRVAGAPALRGPAMASVFAARMLEWSNTEAEQYRVWINDVTAGGTKLLEKTVSGTAMLLTSKLEERHRYRYWVQRIDGAAATAWGSPRIFTLAATTQGLSSSGNVSGNTPTVEWAAYPEATHYDAWVSDGGGVCSRDQAVTETTYTFESAIPDGDCRIWAQPESSSVSAGWSKVVKFGGVSTPVLTSPTISTNDRTPTFAWTQDASASTTEIWINHNGMTNRLVHETTLTGISYTPDFMLAREAILSGCVHEVRPDFLVNGVQRCDSKRLKDLFTSRGSPASFALAGFSARADMRRQNAA